MNLKGIIAIAGMSGLYKVIAQTKAGGFIVESLTENRRTAVSSTTRISALEDITVYSVNEDVPLKTIFGNMKASAASPASPKDDPAKLRDYFKTILPEYDEARVYTSDIKKMVSWFSIVKDLPEEEAPEVLAEETVTEKASEIAEDSPKTKAPKKAKTAKAKQPDLFNDSAPATETTKTTRKKKKED
jgi:hypothetical protein